MTGAQAVVEALIAEGVEIVFGLFGHGNVQLGEALYARRDRIRFITVRNEQAGVHAAAAYARLTGRPQAVTTSVGPGATNLVTGAAMARINRWPVLLLPGEIFAENVGPVLQELETTIDATANESLRPVSKFWTRVSRASRLRRSLREAFESMLEPGQEGPATLCLPMDVQAEAFDFDGDRLASRDRRYPRPRADETAIREAAALLASARRPLFIAGGGVLRSGAQSELMALAERLGAPVAPTQAGKGAVLFEHPLNAFGVGPTGSAVGNHLAARADVVFGVGTRYSDFTTASDTAFAPDARFVNLNVSHFDVGKQRALKLWGDAKATLALLEEELDLLGTAKKKEGSAYAREIAEERAKWIAETDVWRARPGSPLRQSRALAVINDALDAKSVAISAAGTLPGDLQKLWRDKDPEGNGYLCEYGYSTMGFEIAAGLGAKLAMPERRVVVLVGDMSFLMMPGELVTGAQLGIAFTVIVFDNRGGQSIRGLQRRSGFPDYGMEFTTPAGGATPLDFAAIATGMGCRGLRADDVASLEAALAEAATVTDRPTVIDLKVDKEDFMGGYGGWWDVPQPEVDGAGAPREARARYLQEKKKQVVR
jgi:3D-(3,5/4)-trihydroxycyclohexane-1,2-dione acylhydrolase (decyclizing)